MQIIYIFRFHMLDLLSQTTILIGLLHTARGLHG